MTLGLNLPTIKTDDYKKLTCGKCMHQERAPRPPGKPIDLKEPIVLICRAKPPQVVVAIGQGQGGQPVPIPLGSMFPMIDANYPACSCFSPIQSPDITT